MLLLVFCADSDQAQCCDAPVLGVAAAASDLGGCIGFGVTAATSDLGRRLHRIWARGPNYSAAAASDLGVTADAADLGLAAAASDLGAAGLV